MIELVAERGYAGVTVRGLSKRAGVSTRTFYRHFRDTADCLAFVCESTMLSVVRGIEEASSESGDWEESMRAAVTSMMKDFGAQPDASAVALIEAFGGGSFVLARTDAATNTLEQHFAHLLAAAPQPILAPRRLAKGMVAGALRIARTTTWAGRAAELTDLAPDVCEWMLSLVLVPGNDLVASTRITSSTSGRREVHPFPDPGPLGAAVSIGDEKERILRATVRLAAANGLPGLTIPRIRRAAGVSRRTIDSHFENVTECFLDSLEWLVRSAAARARAWAGDEKDRDRRTARLLLSLSAQAARNNALAGLVFAGTVGAGRAGLISREHLVALGATAIHDDHGLSGVREALALEASVAATWRIAALEVEAGRGKRLPGLSPLLTHMVLAPARAAEARPRMPHLR
jgi:AcrR family transcriptional regulator